MTDFIQFRDTLVKFRDDRNWKQFHTLKNLMISLNLESAELLELAQWKSDEEMQTAQNDDAFQQSLRDECADVFMYLLLIADVAGFDLLDAAAGKLAKNNEKYPVSRSYGSSRKYSELDKE